MIGFTVRSDPLLTLISGEVFAEMSEVPDMTWAPLDQRLRAGLHRSELVAASGIPDSRQPPIGGPVMVPRPGISCCPDRRSLYETERSDAH